MLLLCVGGIFEVAVGAGSDAIVRVCRKYVMFSMPGAENDRVLKSKVGSR